MAWWSELAVPECYHDCRKETVWDTRVNKLPKRFNPEIDKEQSRAFWLSATSSRVSPVRLG